MPTPVDPKEKHQRPEGLENMRSQPHTANHAIPVLLEAVEDIRPAATEVSANLPPASAWLEEEDLVIDIDDLLADEDTPFDEQLEVDADIFINSEIEVTTEDDAEIEAAPLLANMPKALIDQDAEIELMFDEDLDIDVFEATASTLASQTPLPHQGLKPEAGHKNPAAQAIPHSTASPLAGSEDENPFLPAHLREKLRQSKAGLMQEIQASTNSVNASSALLKASSNYTPKNRERAATTSNQQDLHSHKTLIDSLVAQYLPIIAEELRKRLTAELAATPPQ